MIILSRHPDISYLHLSFMAIIPVVIRVYPDNNHSSPLPPTPQSITFLHRSTNTCTGKSRTPTIKYLRHPDKAH